jgi:hypothetical protein
MDNLKAEQLTGAKWRVLAIPFGGPFKGGKDLDGEFFDADTDIKPHWFKARPVLFHHGQDQDTKDEDFGEEELDDAPKADGWWGTVWLDRSARYWSRVDALLRAGKMYGSSGSIGHMVRKDRKSGHIEVWPHVEQTLTPTPANPYARITAAKALAGFTSAGIAVPDDLLDDLSTDGEPAGDLSTDGDAAAMKAAALTRIDRLVIATRAIR